MFSEVIKSFLEVSPLNNTYDPIKYRCPDEHKGDSRRVPSDTRRGSHGKGPSFLPRVPVPLSTLRTGTAPGRIRDTARVALNNYCLLFGPDVSTPSDRSYLKFERPVVSVVWNSKPETH